MANAIGTRSRNSTRIAMSSSGRLMRPPRWSARARRDVTQHDAEDGAERDESEADDGTALT